MADVAENLRAFLLADSTVKTLTGGRVYQDIGPEGGKRPFVAYQISGSRRERCLDDAAGSDPLGYTFRVDSVADTRNKAELLRQAINDCLDSYRGTFGDTTIKAAFCEDANDDYEPFSIPADAGLFVAGMSVEVVL